MLFIFIGASVMLQYSNARRCRSMCRWMGSHFHNWVDYNGVTFSVELIEWGRTFRDFWDKKDQESSGKRGFKNRKICG